jgi:DDE superfamily endonuclease/Archaeal putative transposase ISC1217
MAIVTERRRKRLSPRTPERTRARIRAVRRRVARKARTSRRRIDRIHRRLPAPVHDVFGPLAPAFTRPTYRRFVLLALAAILTIGAHTVANLLRTLGRLAPGESSSYHAFFSRDRWSPWALARRLAASVLDRLAPEGIVELAVDDTVTEHPGRAVYGKGCHRDPVRSTRSFTAYRWGHKWVALVVLVKVPWATRRWALPLLLALYRPKGPARRHKTPAQRARQLLRVLLRWFPERRFVCGGDGTYGTHEFAGLAARHPGRLTIVSRFYADANLAAPPPPYSGKGRPRVKGEDLPEPAAVVAATAPRRAEVDWYGGGRRRVEVVSGVGCWHRSGQGLVPVRWVFVHDRTGTHRDEYFFTTDQAMAPEAVIAAYTGRWNIETTFAELRAFLGLETTRGRSRLTVLRAEPCLFGLYTVVVLLYAALPARWRRERASAWPGKRDITFSDAITAVRRWLWLGWVFAAPGPAGALRKLPAGLRRILLNALAPAA